MNWLFYLLEGNVCLLVFYCFYRLMLQRETFYAYNRYYLLVTSAVAFILPLVKLGVLRPQNTVQHTPYTPSFESAQLLIHPNVHPVTPVLTADNIALIIYATISGIFLIKFIMKLFSVIMLARKNNIEQVEGLKIVFLPGSKASFSFLNYLFIDPELKGLNTIIQHEKSHIHHRHTIDVLILELLQVVNWFNPFVYLIKEELKALHEFMADAESLDGDTDAEKYAMFLIGHSYKMMSQPLSSQMFGDRLLKTRITRLYQKRSHSALKWKYTLTLPLILIVVSASSVTAAKNYGIDLFPKQVSALRHVPTAGHRKSQPAEAGEKAIEAHTGSTKPHVALPQMEQTHQFGQVMAQPMIYPTLNIDARTDTVSIIKSQNNTRQGFNGIFVIDGKIYSAAEINAAMDNNGELKIIMASRPVVGMYTPNDVDAIKRWGERARSGVMFITSRDTTSHAPPE